MYPIFKIKGRSIFGPVSLTTKQHGKGVINGHIPVSWESKDDLIALVEHIAEHNRKYAGANECFQPLIDFCDFNEGEEKAEDLYPVLKPGTWVYYHSGSKNPELVLTEAVPDQPYLLKVGPVTLKQDQIKILMERERPAITLALGKGQPFLSSTFVGDNKEEMEASVEEVAKPFITSVKLHKWAGEKAFVHVDLDEGRVVEGPIEYVGNDIKISSFGNSYAISMGRGITIDMMIAGKITLMTNEEVKALKLKVQYPYVQPGDILRAPSGRLIWVTRIGGTDELHFPGWGNKVTQEYLRHLLDNCRWKKVGHYLPEEESNG